MKKPHQISDSHQKTVLVESIRQGYSIWHFLRYSVIADIANRINQEFVLDLGCGIGLQECLLVGKKILGVDIDPRLVRKARKITQSFATPEASSHSFAVSDLRFPPLKKEAFDIILCTEVLEHLEDDRKALEVMLKLLRKTGFLILTLPNAHRSSLTRTVRFMGRRVLMSPSHVREYEFGTMKTLVESLSIDARISRMEGIYLDFPPFKVINLLYYLIKSLRSNRIFHLFVNDFVRRLYESLWSKLENHLSERAFYILVVLRHR